MLASFGWSPEEFKAGMKSLGLHLVGCGSKHFTWLVSGKIYRNSWGFPKTFWISFGIKPSRYNMYIIVHPFWIDPGIPVANEIIWSLVAARSGFWSSIRQHWMATHKTWGQPPHFEADSYPRYPQQDAWRISKEWLAWPRDRFHRNRDTLWTPQFLSLMHKQQHLYRTVYGTTKARWLTHRYQRKP